MSIEKSKKKRWNWKKIIVSFIGVLVIGLIFGFFFVHHYINKSLPQVEGTIEIPVSSEVVVYTDENGVPHIKADNAQDLYTAQGYVQAQNRIFQMELSRRQASGTLSELIGEATVSSDKYFRTLGLRRAAEKSYDHYSEDAKKVLQWFSDGVNAYIKDAKANGTLPVEFTLIGTEPGEWTPIDSLTIGKYMAFDLGGHWERQAFNYYLLNQFSLEKAYELFPSYPKGRMTILDEEEINIAASFKEAIIPEPFNGSNNWVISGEKTASGMPLLADDPHLGLGTPSIWYQMHLESNDLNVSGVIFAGVPGIILGHNENIAWGVTNTGPDVQQLYMEKRNPQNKEEYLFEGEWERANMIKEPIKVKGKETVDYEVVETRHGPVVSEFAEDGGKDAVLSLRWTALDATTELQAILNLNKASNWEEFEKALEDFHAPAQNFVFSSIDGTIAYKANGKIPIYDNSEDALLPLPGWDQKYEWNDFIPFDELPKVVNPEKGFIATANNKVAGESYPYHISNVWAQPYRYERIFEVLAENDQLTVQDMKDLQMDAVNLRAREFVPIFIQTLKEEQLSEAEENALSVLREWNYVDDVDLAGPLIFDEWFAEIETIMYEEISDDVMHLFSNMGQSTDELLRLGNDSIWIDDHGGIKSILKESLTKTVANLEDAYGKKQESWKWGDYHKVEFKHPLASANKVLGYYFNAEKPLPVNGSGVTPLAARHYDNGIVYHGASWRFVIDLDDISVGHHIVGPGQSGHVKSPWYNDQVEDWVEGNYHETTISNEEGMELKLIPEQ
ncbi:penicillin acylase family protein [Pseudogracilibacillus auburnensis]|uniref:penicillin acylase family protein n=1 Tax=Pseudogracilibacillus auburnensis TaxID=1494959 RepID=UPI001A974690|nr:penicillin acylase family protein [Pseudogracilibacillus auburnensis]MBO1003644.1 penicillin acylase family protein [Pseudogracilibacillus auburnensis]